MSTGDGYYQHGKCCCCKCNCEPKIFWPLPKQPQSNTQIKQLEEAMARVIESGKSEILTTSPQPRDWVVPSNDVIDTLWHKATHESVAHSEPFTRYRFTELLIKQLNTKG